MRGHSPRMGTWYRLPTAVANAFGMGQPSPDRIRAMLAARRRIVDNVVRPNPDPLSSRVAVMGVLKPRSGEMRDLVSSILPEEVGAVRNKASDHLMPIWRGDVDGLFTNTPGTHAIGVASYRAGDWPTRRHELMHGYTEAARRGYGGLPLSARVSASLPEGLGVVADELVAQRAGGTAFGDIDWGWYASFYAAQGNKSAAAAARAMQAVQKAGDYAPYVAAGAAGTGLMAYGLSQEDDSGAVAQRDMDELMAYLRSARQ